MNNTQKELSWFKLSLLHFLYESHPELIEDTNLLNSRGELAAETYSEAITNGHNHQEAEELIQRASFFKTRYAGDNSLERVFRNSPNGRSKRLRYKSASKI